MAAHPEGPASAGGSEAPAQIPQLVAEVYESASTAERGALLVQLLRPLGLLSMVTVADGIFARTRLRSGWQDLSVRLDDLQNVQASHVVALVDRAQQVSVEAVDGLAQILAVSPLLSGSAAAGLLLALLLQRQRARNGRHPE